MRGRLLFILPCIIMSLPGIPWASAGEKAARAVPFRLVAFDLKGARNSEESLEVFGSAYIRAVLNRAKNTLDISVDSFRLEFDSASGDSTKRPEVMLSTLKSSKHRDFVFDLEEGCGTVELDVELDGKTVRTLAGRAVKSTASFEINHVYAGAITPLGAFTTSIRLDLRDYPKLAKEIGSESLEVTAYMAEQWPTLPDECVREIQRHLRRRDCKRALEALIACLQELGIDLSAYDGRDSGIEFRPGHPDTEGMTVTTRYGTLTVIGPAACASVALLYSVLMHEIKHANQHNGPNIPKRAVRELEAWLQECENLTRTGLINDPGHKAHIKRCVEYFFSKLSPQEQRPFRQRVEACRRVQ